MVEMKEEKHFVINYWRRDGRDTTHPRQIRNLLPCPAGLAILPQLINHESDLCDC